MALRFCNCGGLLKEKADENLEFECIACSKDYEPRPEDTLLQEDIIGISISNFDILIRTAPFDRLNPIAKKYCEKCKKDTWVNYIYLGENLVIVYSCLRCHFQWS